MKVQGKVFRYGDNVDTDVIIPARYLNTSDSKELAAHCMEDIDAEFVGKVEPRRHHRRRQKFGMRLIERTRTDRDQRIKVYPVLSRQTFARIFYRNAINIGLPIMECVEASEKIENDDIVEVDFLHGSDRQ